MDKSVKVFKIVGISEAISYLLLLGVAMPLKYVWDKPEMVKIVGMAHGLLFTAYVLGAIYMKMKLDWSWKTLFIVMICSVLPFGPFFVDRKYLV